MLALMSALMTLTAAQPSGILPTDYPACAGHTSTHICQMQLLDINRTGNSLRRQSRRTANSRSWTALVRPSILYLSFHQGTAMDLSYVFERLGITFKWIVPSHLPYEVTKELAHDDHNRYSSYQCGLFDFIIVGDTVARARALLEHGCKESQIILHVTQRFDAGMEGQLKQEWIELLKNASATMPNNVRMVINNPYEQWYMQNVRQVSFFQQPMLIRPSGHWPEEVLPPPNAGKPDATAVVVQPYLPYLNEILIGNLTEMGLPFEQLSHGQYGGARGLAQYRCAVHMPYQVSVMAMYENLAAGVVLMVPSQKFYSSMAPQLLEHGVSLHLVDLPVLQKQAGGWEAMEWFSPYFKDAFVHFDSWQHLKELLQPGRSYGQHQQRLREFMAQHTEQVVGQWASLLWCRQRCNGRPSAAAAGAPSGQ